MASVTAAQRVQGQRCSAGCIKFQVSRRCQVPAPLVSAKRFSTVASDDAMPEKLSAIVMGFKSVPDPMARYKQLLFFATKLEALPAEYQQEDYKVPGCVSQVWVVPRMEDGKVFFKADSDSQLTKGLAALLVQGLSGSAPEEILKLSPDFIQELGLQQSLTPSRNNGFLNMFLTMQKKTLQLYMQEQAKDDHSEASEREAGSDQEEEEEQQTVYTRIERKVREALQPTRLVLVDESDQHRGHAGVHKGASETHFRLEVVSEAFEGQNRVRRHRVIYQLLDEEIRGGVHALSLNLKTPSEL